MDRYFEFNGIKSIDQDYHVVYFPQDYFERITYGGRSIEENGFKEQKLEFTLMLARMDSKDNLLPFDRYSINELGKWLVQDEFKPIRFSYDMDKIYYVIVKDISPLSLDRVENGFVEVTFETSTSHAFTNPREDIYYIEESKEIDIISEQAVGQRNYPTLELLALDKTDVKITNLGTGQQVKITDLKKDDAVIIDNEHRMINGSLDKIFTKFNREWLYLRRGSNLLKVEGNVRLTIKTQYAIL